MQSYALVTMVLVMVTIGTVSYAWPQEQKGAPRTAVLANAKPVDTLAKVAPIAIAANELIEVKRPPSASRPTSSSAASSTEVDASDATELSPILPVEFNTLSSKTFPSSSTSIGDLTFSSKIDGRYRPIGARSVFASGNYTLYATFDYADMKDGMEWSWVWRYEGEVIGGGNKIWDSGDEGPGYVFLRPEEGFEPGNYSVDIWVNDQLFTYSTIIVAASAANN